MSLLDLKRKIDYNIATINHREWKIIKSDANFLYLTPLASGSSVLLRVPKGEVEKTVLYKTINPVGEIVKKHRTLKEWSQRELAGRSEVSQMTISNIENGSCEKINSDTLDAVLRTLEIPLEVVYRTCFS